MFGMVNVGSVPKFAEDGGTGGAGDVAQCRDAEVETTLVE